jgi:hypothetical protein
MSEGRPKIDLGWILMFAIACLGIWLTYQQVKIAELQTAEQKRQTMEQQDKDAREKEERLRPKVSVSQNGDTVRILVERRDPVTDFVTTTEILTTEQGWKDLEKDIRERKLREKMPPVPKN